MSKIGKILTICSVGMMMVLIFGNPVSAMERIECDTTQKAADFEIQSETLMWKYKTVNGVQYKRLWNTTELKWMSDWIKC